MMEGYLSLTSCLSFCRFPTIYLAPAGRKDDPIRYQVTLPLQPTPSSVMIPGYITCPLTLTLPTMPCRVAVSSQTCLSF